MSEVLLEIMVALCVAAPAPCYTHGDVLQVPVYTDTAHTLSDDLITLEYEGVTIKPVHWHEEI